MIDAALYARLTAAPAVAAIVGTNVYASRAPQNITPPWVRWQRISRTTSRDLQRIEGLVETRVQFDCVHTDYTLGSTLADAVRAALQNWTDVNAGIDDADCTNIRDYHEQVGNDFYFVNSLDFIITHQAGV